MVKSTFDTTYVHVLTLHAFFFYNTKLKIGRTSKVEMLQLQHECAHVHMYMYQVCHRCVIRVYIHVCTWYRYGTCTCSLEFRAKLCVSKTWIVRHITSNTHRLRFAVAVAVLVSVLHTLHVKFMYVFLHVCTYSSMPVFKSFWWIYYVLRVTCTVPLYLVK